MLSLDEKETSDIVINYPRRRVTDSCRLTPDLIQLRFRPINDCVNVI